MGHTDTEYTDIVPAQCVFGNKNIFSENNSYIKHLTTTFTKVWYACTVYKRQARGGKGRSTYHLPHSTFHPAVKPAARRSGLPWPFGFAIKCRKNAKRVCGRMTTRSEPAGTVREFRCTAAASGFLAQPWPSRPRRAIRERTAYRRRNWPRSNDFASHYRAARRPESIMFDFYPDGRTDGRGAFALSPRRPKSLAKTVSPIVCASGITIL